MFHLLSQLFVPMERTHNFHTQNSFEPFQHTPYDDYQQQQQLEIFDTGQ